MIIGVDGNEANVFQKVGVSVYTLNLLNYFSKWSNSKVQFRVFLRNRPLEFLPKENDNYRYVVVKGSFLWSQVFLPLNLYLKNKVDVFFSPAHYAPRFCPAPIVVSIHDLSYLVYPNEFLKKDLYQLKNWTKYSVDKASKIIAVSKTTKKDLMKFYNLPEGKIEVIYNGFEKNIGERNYDRTSKVKKDKYLLFVGTIQPRKNLQVLLKAFEQFTKINHEYKLVVVGKKGWLFEDIFKEMEKLGLKSKVNFTGHISDDELIDYYKNAYCFVMPSLYEGFGIPILEAMANNCPVISSFSSSLPEIGGEACLYFDPNDALDLVDKFNSLLANNGLRNNLIKKGKERVKLFSWKKCAEETLKVIQNVYDQSC